MSESSRPPEAGHSLPLQRGSANTSSAGYGSSGSGDEMTISNSPRKDAHGSSQPAPPGNSGPKRISLDKASRSELVEFIREQQKVIENRGTRMQELIAAYKKLTAEKTELEKALSAIQATPKSSVSNEEVEQLQQKVKDLQDENHVLSSLQRSLQEEVDRLIAERKTWEEARQRADTKIAQLEEALRQAEEKNTAAANEYRRLEEDKQLLTQQLDDVRTSVHENEVLIRRLEEENKQLREAHATADRELDSLHRQKEELQELVIRAESAKLREESGDDGLIDKISSLERRVEELLRDADTHNQQLTALKRENEQLRQDIEQSKRENEDSRIKIAEIISERQTLIVEKQQLEQKSAHEIAVLRDQYEALRRDKEALERQIEELKESKEPPTTTTSPQSPTLPSPAHTSATPATSPVTTSTSPASTVNSDQQLEVQLLTGKVNKLKALLAMANKHITEGKKQLQERQIETERYRTELESATAELARLRGIEADASYRLAEVSNAYRTQLAQLEGELQKTRAELHSVQFEFRSYKVRAHSALKERTDQSGGATSSARPADGDGLELAERLQLEVDELRRRLRELEEYNRQLVRTQHSADALADEVRTAQQRIADLTRESDELRRRHREAEREWAERVERLQREMAAAAAAHAEALMEAESKNAEKFEELAAQLKAYRERAAAELEEKQQQIAELSALARELQAKLAAAATAEADTARSDAIGQPAVVVAPAPVPGTFHYAQMQSKLEEELARAKAEIAQLTELLRDAEQMDNLHRLQEGMLKAEIRELERAKARAGVNIEYLKNIVVKYMETDEHETLLPVIATVLQLSPDEVQRINSARAGRKPWFGKTKAR